MGFRIVASNLFYNLYSILWGLSFKTVAKFDRWMNQPGRYNSIVELG